MTLATLAIQAEAWLQEELGAQLAVLAALERLEDGARAGRTSDLERQGRELETLLAPASARETRRQALLERLGRALALPAREVTLAKLAASLSAAGLETQRLESARRTLSETVRAVLTLSRRLAAQAQYHRGVLEELCQVLLSGATQGAGHLVDARG